MKRTEPMLLGFWALVFGYAALVLWVAPGMAGVLALAALTVAAMFAAAVLVRSTAVRRTRPATTLATRPVHDQHARAA